MVYKGGISSKCTREESGEGLQGMSQEKVYKEESGDGLHGRV